MNTENLNEEQLQFFKEFTNFVKFYNSINGVKISAKDALKNDHICELFIKFKEENQETNKKIEKSGIRIDKKQKTTKKTSYDLTNIPKLDKQVLDYIRNFPRHSRADIAKGTGRRISTICGAVNRLIKAKMIYVGGNIYDFETNRNVETFVVTDNMLNTSTGDNKEYW